MTAGAGACVTNTAVSIFVFKRCCASPPSSDFGLMCGMAQASRSGDCAKALADVRAYAKETGKPACK